MWTHTPQRQIKAYKKEDSSPHQVKPVPIMIVIYIMLQHYGNTQTKDEMTIVNMIMIAFFLLLWPGEYTCTVLDNAVFKHQDVHLYIQGW
jgi:hypothetical protein